MALDGNESNGPSSAGEIIQHNRYRRLLKRPLRKTTQEAGFRFNNYVFTMASSNSAVVYIFRALFIFQMGFASLLPFNKDLWIEGSLPYKILNIFSVFAYIIPINTPSNTFSLIAILLSVLFTVGIFVFLYSLYSFNKDSKLSTFLVYFCSIMLTALIPYLGNISFYYAAKAISYFIRDMNPIFCIIVLVMSLINGIVSLFLYSSTAAIFLSMRLTSPSIQSFKFAFFYHILIYLSTFCLFLSTGFGKNVSLICMLVSSVLLIIALVLTFNNLVWQSVLTQDLHKALNSADIFVILLMIPKVFSNGTNSENEIFIFTIIVILFFLLYRYLSKRRTAKYTTILDQMEAADSIDENENMKPKQVASILYYGFFYGHPFAHSWRGFDLADEKWPNNRDLTILLLRCVSIYPYESARLRSTLIRAVSMKKGDYELKKLISEGQTLLQQRERNLSKNLKKQLGKIKEKSDKCIGQIRHIWECIIRGSVAELEPLSAQLKKMEDDVIKDYNQLLSIFSNNPYVVHAYSTFLHDVACNQTEGNRYHAMYKSLRSGARVLNEKSYFFAIREFPMIPDDDAHSQMAHKDIEEVTSGNIHQEKSVQSFIIGANDQQWGDEDNEVNTNSYVESLVSGISLPSTKIFKVFVLVFFIVCAIATTVPFIIVFRSRVHDCTNAFSAIHTILMTLTNYLDAALLSLQISSFNNSFALSLKQKYVDVRGSAEGLPPSWETDYEALRVRITHGREWNDKVEQVFPILKKSGFFDKTLNNMFNPVYKFKAFQSLDLANPPPEVESSYQRLLTFYLSSLTTTLNGASFSLKNPDFFTATRCINTTIEISAMFLDDLVEEYNIMLSYMSQNIRYLPVIIGAIIILVDAIVLFMIIKETNREKALIYSSFKAIPKSAISNIIQKLNMSMNKNIDDTEESKLSIQEENALRMLSTSNTQKSINSYEVIFLIIPVALFFIAYTAIIILLPISITSTITSIKNIGISLRTLTEIPINLINVVTAAYRYVLSNDPVYGVKYPDNQEDIIRITQDFFKSYKRLLNNIRIGTDKSGNGLNTIGDISHILSYSYCTPEYINIGDLGVIDCSSYETATSIIHQSIYKLFTTNLELGDTNDLLYAVYYIDYKSTEQTLEPSIELGSETVFNFRSSYDNMMTFPCILILVVIVIVSLVAFTGITAVGDNTLWCLRLLLFCPQNIILGSKVILKILSNDFSSSTEDSFGHGASFYETLVSHLLNGTLFLDNQLTIKSANDAAEGILGVKNEEILEKNIHDVLTPAPGKEAGLHAFFTALEGAMTSLRSPNIECEADIAKGNETLTVQINVVAVSISGEVQMQPTNSEGLAMITIVIKDLTSTIAARTLLREEHDKGENLLNMILPQIIVKKLQKGESNISFSVQSASILFMDIVSFTPWCGSLPAATVMKTLNKLFAVYDKNLARYDRMIKIKCIGDCYMAAGGVFDEVNQPAEHCKQAISFCLDAISSLELFDVENNQSLRIRAGINCGGPIIAGVLGIEKPTFDILGPAISIAAAMEHNGVPMNVHIPQHMYELVYDQPFQFKERGDIEIKGKQVHTYLVTGYA